MLRADLLRLVPDERRVNDGESALDQHAADLSYHVPHRPDVVVYPETTAEVSAPRRRTPWRARAESGRDS